MIIALCKGFLESADSDLAKLETLAGKLQTLSPAISFKRYQWDDPIDPTCDAYFGNSFGGAAIFDLLEKNPGMKPKLVTTVDAFANPFIGQALETIWNLTRYPNVGQFTVFREPYSVLKGNHSYLGPNPTSFDIWPFSVKRAGTLFEYVLATRDPGLAFNEHFEILNHPVAMDACVNAVKVAL